MDILLVEDDAPKQERILSFLEQNWPAAHVRTARSVRSAIRELRHQKPDLILLDVSLPTFDVGPNETGGRPQNFGGVEVLRYMDLYEQKIPTIVVTAYEAFSKEGQAIDHDSLDDQLSKEHPNSYRGIIYYNSLFSEWRTMLEDVISSQIGQGKST
jgi:CheY-like chemotaxis protein